MNIGYFFNGHLGDKLSKESKDTPDGNAWYSSSIIYECLLRNHNVYLFGKDKDFYDWKKYNVQIFNSFEKINRLKAYQNSNKISWKYSNSECAIINKPQIDIILLEWRFPISGRNTKQDLDKKDFQWDLLMQEYILENYTCPIIIFDLDYKMTIEDEKRLNLKENIIIFETSNKSKRRILERVQVEIPFWMKNLNIIKNTEISKYKDIVYIGSRYERDDTINKYIFPYSNIELFKVWFYGNWRKYSDKYDELYNKLNWRNIQYHSRVGHENFQEIYSDSVCCPLLAKDEYYKNGFMTARIQECLYFGSIPIGFIEHYQINKYLPKELIANDFEDFYEKVQKLKKLSIENRNKLRQDLWNRLEFMDVSYFVDKIEERA